MINRRQQRESWSDEHEFLLRPESIDFHSEWLTLVTSGHEHRVHVSARDGFPGMRLRTVACRVAKICDQAGGTSDPLNRVWALSVGWNDTHGSLDIQIGTCSRSKAAERIADFIEQLYDNTGFGSVTCHVVRPYERDIRPEASHWNTQRELARAAGLTL